MKPALPFLALALPLSQESSLEASLQAFVHSQPFLALTHMPCQAPFVSKNAKRVDLSFPLSSCCFFSTKIFGKNPSCSKSAPWILFQSWELPTSKLFEPLVLWLFLSATMAGTLAVCWQAISGSTGKSSALTLGKNPFTKAASDAALEPSSGLSSSPIGRDMRKTNRFYTWTKKLWKATCLEDQISVFLKMIWQTILDFLEDHLGRPLSQIYVKKPRRSNFGCQFKTWSARLFWEDWKQACQSRIWTGSLVFKLPEWSASRVGVQFLNWQLGFRSDTKHWVP